MSDVDGAHGGHRAPGLDALAAGSYEMLLRETAIVLALNENEENAVDG